MPVIVSLFTTYLPYFVLVLTLLVFVHEFGHYWVGRRFGIHAEVFSIGFGPELFGWTDRQGTRWKVAAIPLGGYVKFLGDNDASQRYALRKSRCRPNSTRRAFFTQPLYARAAVVLGGPVANLLFALAAAHRPSSTVAGEPYSPADRCGQGRWPGRTGGAAHGRSDHPHERQAHRSLRRHPGHAVPLSRTPDGCGVSPWRQPLRGEIVPRFCERTDKYNNKDAVR